MGCPCRAWSIARKGIKNEIKARAVDELCLQFALFCVEAIRVCQECGVLWSLENPTTSKLFQFGPIRNLFALKGVFEVKFDACQYNGMSRKPTSLLTNARSLFRLEKSCPGTSPQHQHELLQGSKKVECADGSQRWLSKTKLAGAYTHSLCRAWSLAIARCAPPEARKQKRGMPVEDTVVGLYGALPRSAGQTPEEVRRSVEVAFATLQLERFDDAIAEADLYDLGDASAASTEPCLSAARRYLAKHEVIFGGGRLRGGPHEKKGRPSH